MEINMPKEIPLISGQYYHIYNRGNNGENLFIEERNYHYFFDLYIRYIYSIANTYAYCLMKNHFHLLVRMKPAEDLPGFENLAGLSTPNYSKPFSNLFNAYTKTINKTYQRKGSLFQKPFKRILVDSDTYLMHLVNYIHRNPLKHGFTDDFRTYPYSSYQSIYQQKNSRIEALQVMNWFGNPKSFAEYHEQSDETKIKHLIEDD
jgi:REP element-mobilizing transposase RayT